MFTERPLERCFELLFGDGAALRDALVLSLDDGHQALRSWDSFMMHLSSCDDDLYRELLNHACAEHRSGRVPANPDLATEPNGHVDAEQVGQFLLPADSDTRLAEAITEVVHEPGRVLRWLVLEYLNRVGSSSAEVDLERQIEDAANRMAGRSIPEEPSLAHLMLTGADVPDGDREQLDGCPEVHFVLSPGVAATAEVRYVGERAVVPFEPCEYPEKLAMPVDVYEALGNEMRMRIVLILARRGEMYGAELVELIGAPQATVSNHLSKLEAAGMVRRRPYGRRTYYRLVPETLDRAAERLTQLRIAVHDPIQRELPID